MVSFGVPLLVLLAVGAVLAVAIAGAVALAVSGKRMQSENTEELGSRGRTLLRPLKQDLEEMKRIMALHPDLPHIQTVGGQMVAEGEALIARAGAMAVRINELRQLSRGRTRAEMELRRLEGNPRQRAAAEAKQEELAQYDRAELAIAQAEEAIGNLQGALGRVKSALLASAVRASTPEAETASSDDLRNQLESLRASLEEAETFLQQTSS